MSSFKPNSGDHSTVISNNAVVVTNSDVKYFDVLNNNISANIVFKTASDQNFKTAKQNFNQFFNTKRQTGSSIKKENVVVESLEIKKLNQTQLRNFKQTEIRRIIDKSNEMFEQFYIENDDEMKKMHNALFFLIHFDKQIPKWKNKTTEAQSNKQKILIKWKKTDHQLIINNIWNNFKSFIGNIKSEQTKNFKKSHQSFWKVKMFAKSIHQLQFDFYDSHAFFFILSINDTIEKHNEKHNYSLNCENFFFKYFNYEYRFAQKQRQKHENTNDFEKKKKINWVWMNYA